MTNKERYEQIEEAIQLGFLTLNDWETGFLNDMHFKHIAENLDKLTWNQQKKLIEIWEKIE